MNLSLKNELAIADLRFLLPMHPGDKVLLSDSFQILEEELGKIGVSYSQLSMITEGRESINSEKKFDFAILPILSTPNLEDALRVIIPMLNDGAYVICGTKNSGYWLKYLKSYTRDKDSEINFNKGLATFQKMGFSLLRLFGNPDKISNPRFLVDLDSKEPTLHFISHILTPYTRKGAISWFIAKYFFKAFQYTSFYPSMIWLTQKNSSDGVVCDA
jgi:hypothetical protein